MMVLRKITILAVLLGTPGLNGFDYQNPEEWGKEAEGCNGKKQSPINMDMDDAVNAETDNPLTWNGYGNVPSAMKIVNNGHTIQLNPTWENKDDIPYLEGGPLNGKYILLQIHFHWGPENDAGSEHTLQGKPFPLECHMVHKKVDYESVSDALKQTDGLAVVGSFYDIGDDDQESDLFGILKDPIASVADTKGEKDMDPFSIDNFDVVTIKSPYLSYSGSLTTPGCNEVVTWIVSTGGYSTTDESMGYFRTVKLAHADKSNYRPVQPLNDRVITLYT